MPDMSLSHFSNMALKALLYEVSLSPKPGLVDRYDDGAHHDMTFTTFIDSSLALAPHFEAYLRAGFMSEATEPYKLFQRLRQLGIKAEQDMFQATGGFNTHKGVNFSLAVILGATGLYLKEHPDLITEHRKFSAKDTEAICNLCQLICQDLINKDFDNLHSKPHLSYGEKLYLEYGITGPRGEAASGFPSLTQKALPFFRKKASQQDKELTQLQLLVYLMSFVEDGNIIHRGGIEAWETVKQEMLELHQTDCDRISFLDRLETYNDKLIKRHLSPGGSADLLALSFYFAFLEGIL